MTETYGLTVERASDAPRERLFDAFIGLYDGVRPDWVTGSELDLRPGGRWTVRFDVPGGDRFTEERVLTAVERPNRLAYELTAVFEDGGTLDTAVEVTIAAAEAGNRLRLEQQGFPDEPTRDVFAGGWRDVLVEVDRRARA